MTRPPNDRSQVRWLAVGGTGVGCGLLLGGLLWMLTGSLAAAVVVGVAVAAILVVLAVAGVRQNARFRDTDERLAETRARQARARQALSATRRPERPPSTEPPDHRTGTTR